MMFCEGIGGWVVVVVAVVVVVVVCDEGMMCLEVGMRSLMAICWFRGRFGDKNCCYCCLAQPSWSTLLPVPTRLQMNLITKTK